MSTMLKCVVIGASGYTGAELVRLLLQHPHVEIVALTADTQAGKRMQDVYPHLGFSGLPDLVTLDAVDFSGADVVFCCLPHGTTQTVVKNLPESVKVIDLSADFRLRDPELYEQWYGGPHQAVDLQEQAVYGLTEYARDALRDARLVACPGCYPTSVLLPLLPLLQHRLIRPDAIIADAKSGVTGAGRSVKQSFLFSELHDGMFAYGVGKHRHRPEIEQELSHVAKQEVCVSFTPHLVPMNRGILSTIYVTLTSGKTANYLRDQLATAYADEPFVQVVGEAVFPTTNMVRGTNQCAIGVYADSHSDRAVIVSVIDNLMKGAAGQAVQNFNVMMGFDEATALKATAVFP